jgi:hypothetical protein
MTLNFPAARALACSDLLANLVVKCIDLKSNLVLDENFANTLKAIDLMMMIPVSPYLARQLSGFMIMNLYGGAHESGNRLKHKGMQEF